ncbi:sensor histidine kinase [Metabacillus litoralis]|uniref:sensor histidine kinase n=1 Tax=Metabacillus litoralis TaxID=152268 RepID=UPI001CFEC308|nr:HAMP domain-containing sensor histidine kinase [Metabacillus litoralis]
MRTLLYKVFPKKEGYLPYLYLINICFPLYFLLQETTAKLLVGLLMLGLFILIYRETYWRKDYIIFLIMAEFVITLIFAYFYHPMYLYMVFVFVYQAVQLPIKWLYMLSAGFGVISVYLIFITVYPDQLYLVYMLLPTVFGGCILPFMIKASLNYKNLSEDLKRLADELQQKNKEMTLLEESKKRMLADLSHDLRTPMTTIQGYSRALYEDLIDNEEQTKKYLKYIYDKSIRVTTLIDELFMFSKLDNPDFKMYKEKLDICEFFREIIVEYYDVFAEKEMELEIKIPSTKIFYQFDQKLLYRAISNILENTLKYNPEQTIVYISLNQSQQSTLIEIGDNGIGINDEVAKTLFDPFTRGDKNRLNDGGSGLGLTISKKIIENHNGKLILETKPSRGKTNFKIVLPNVVS